MNTELDELINNLYNEVLFDENDKKMLENQANEYIKIKIKELEENKINLIYKRMDTIIENIGNRIINKFNLDKEEVSKLINSELFKKDNINLVEENNSIKSLEIKEKKNIKKKDNKEEKDINKKNIKKKDNKEEINIKIDNEEEINIKEEIDNKIDNTEEKKEVNNRKKNKVKTQIIEDKTEKKNKETCILCKAIKPDGTICNKKVKIGEYCGYHKKK